MVAQGFLGAHTNWLGPALVLWDTFLLSLLRPDTLLPILRCLIFLEEFWGCTWTSSGLTPRGIVDAGVPTHVCSAPP